MPDAPYSGTQYDARTGEPLPADWRTPKYEIPTVLDMKAVQENIQNMGVEQALKATEAAIQFQGQRGYQQALKNGETAEKALTKYGPMMFYRTPQAFGPSVRALTPPTLTPYQKARIEMDKATPIHVGQGLYKLDAQGKPVTIVAPPKPKEETGRFVIDEPLPGYPPSTVRIPPRAFAEQMDTLPPYARTNAANVAQLRAAGITNLPSPPAVAPPVSALPLPKSKSELKTGQKYITAKGEATWNGKNFVK